MSLQLAEHDGERSIGGGLHGLLGRRRGELRRLGLDAVAEGCRTLPRGAANRKQDGSGQLGRRNRGLEGDTLLGSRSVLGLAGRGRIRDDIVAFVGVGAERSRNRDGVGELATTRLIEIAQIARSGRGVGSRRELDRSRGGVIADIKGATTSLTTSANSTAGPTSLGGRSWGRFAGVPLEAGAASSPAGRAA